MGCCNYRLQHHHPNLPPLQSMHPEAISLVFFFAPLIKRFSGGREGFFFLVLIEDDPSFLHNARSIHHVEIFYTQRTVVMMYVYKKILRILYGNLQSKLYRFGHRSLPPNRADDPNDTKMRKEKKNVIHNCNTRVASYLRPTLGPKLLY